ncbi:hypothetical protein GCM10025864_30190 [Luteimicrobium album]|uniref:Beta-glucosidase n=1 Tax=Luteimicrobium album TaxID=1054550 RepID=A0ABQ6I662_9MICO|nr:hypothetical protein GCM10025864_30190 [Luteimicrobium album]
MTLPDARPTYPDGFLWGASTSAHQVEGNNVASDVWALENRPGSLLTDRSGDACDSYHRWREDLDLLAAAGLDAYRFSVEWARVEPVPGRVSKAELAHYRRMVEGCLERGITPIVTLHHFTSPSGSARSAGGPGPTPSTCSGRTSARSCRSSTASSGCARSTSPTCSPCSRPS